MAIRPPPPTLPPRYRLWPDPLQAFLGSGGAASVWRVQDQDLGVLVALKVLKDTRPGFLAKMEREAILASRVVHPNVVAVHDIGRTPDGKGYLAFALASDGTMLDVASRPPPWPELLDLTLQLLEALAAMHARGILHLDVKLSNLLLHRGTGGRTQLWLADLGVARALWDDDDDKSVVGTVSYMSPERLTGQHHLWCPSTDLFAVGGVLFRLITGRLPYPARDPSEGLTQRQRPPTALVPRPGLDVPDGLGDVILPMLQFDRRGRYDLASDAIRAFKHLPPVEGPGPGFVCSDNPGGHPEVRPSRGVPAWHRPPPSPPPADLRVSPPERRVPQAPSLLSHREISLVGREPEVELLWRTARTALRTRRPLLVEVSGPRGSGRTRLLSAFTRALEEAGLGEGARMQYAVAEGPNLGLRGAWRRILPPGSRRDIFVREIATTFARDRGASLEQCTSDARLLASWLSPGSARSVALNRSAIRAMMVEHLERRSWRGLSWLWVEDAHLAGENDDCWSIVDQLMMRDVPALVLVDVADDQLTPSLLELRARHHKAVRRIHLEGLRGREAEALVQAHLPLDAALTRLLVPRASSQPKLVKDLLTHWVRTGELHEQVRTDVPGRVWSLSGGVPELPPDGHALAVARLAATELDGPRTDALHAIALGGSGVPESVVARVSVEGLDRLVVDGLVDIQQGRCVLQPDALEGVVLESLAEDRAIALSGRLAEAWLAEGDDPRTAHRVGRHFFEARDVVAALPHLHRALLDMAATLPVPELRVLAERTRFAAEARGGGGRAWLAASLALADAEWRSGDAALARTVDSELLAADLDPDDRMTVICAHLRRSLHRAGSAVGTLVEEGERLLPQVRTPRRADFHATRAWTRAKALDVDGALAELLDALSCRPDPVVGCRARVLRAQLLATIDPMVSWHEALRVVETARDHGLLRYEVLAWGLAADSMVFLGRADEVIERLQSGIHRLEAHGEKRAAHTARLQLGQALVAAGREGSAEDTWRRARAHSSRPSLLALEPSASLALLATLRGEHHRVAGLRPDGPVTDAATVVAWSLLDAIVALRTAPAEPPLPAPSVLRAAVALGLSGMFLASQVIAELSLVGRTSDAAALSQVYAEECARLGVDPDEARPWLERARRSRRT